MIGKNVLIGAGAGLVVALVTGWNKIALMAVGALVGSAAKNFKNPLSITGSNVFAGENVEQNTQVSPQ